VKHASNDSKVQEFFDGLATGSCLRAIWKDGNSKFEANSPSVYLKFIKIL
jgi:hypothetical protein